MLIRREALAAALPATDQNETRYFLSAVQVEPNHRVVATNGHVLIIATDKNPMQDEDFPLVPGAEFKGSPAAPVLVPADTCKRLIAASKPGKRSLPILGTLQLSTNGAPDSITIAATDLQTPTIAHIKPEDVTGTFPKYDRVFPKTDRPAVRVTLSREVLETLLSALRATGAKHNHGGMLEFEIPTSADDQGRKHVDSGHGDADQDGNCPVCHAVADSATRCMVPDGVIVSPLRVRHVGTDVDLDMLAMPCKQ